MKTRRNAVAIERLRGPSARFASLGDDNALSASWL